MKKRIWELDALRGICILGVILFHFVFDLTVLYRIVDWDPPALFTFVQQWGGTLFVVLSGICVTLGSRSVRRGLVVFCGGLLVSAVTCGMYAFGFSDRSIIIYFGVLHCLGVCMLLWPVFRKLHWAILAALGGIFALLGLHFMNLWVDTPWLILLGLTPHGFVTSDYFPLLPYLGFFLLGAALGKTLYRNKASLLPKVNAGWFPLNFFCFCGRQSLWIYLLHQPLLNGICWLILSLS